MRELFVDNFAGGGGASTGIEMAIGRSVDIAINHDPDAIAMHMTNHPTSKHYCEDIWQVDPREACAGNPVALAWFSPDCKHFSRAKGGKPVDKNIRGLAWVTLRWAATVRPRVIMLENVPEIQSWGPLGKDGRPIKERCGETFKSFIYQLRRHGYDIEWRELKSCDYGAPTTRKRFYMIARCDGFPIAWPKPTHADKKTKAVKDGKLLPYRTAAECIDWNIPTQSIFERKKPLAQNTMKRIAKGIVKYVIENPEPYIVNKKQAATIIQYHSEMSDNEVRGQHLNAPIMTIDTSNRYGLANAVLDKKENLVAAHIMVMRNNMDGQPIDEPLSTITSSGAHHAEVLAFLAKYYGDGEGSFAQGIDEPLHTITTKDRFGLVTLYGEEYSIKDIQMRMLQPHELFAAMGFPEDYIIDRDAKGKPYPKSKQVARCGNAVTPQVPAALVEANLPEHCTLQTAWAV